MVVSASQAQARFPGTPSFFPGDPGTCLSTANLFYSLCSLGPSPRTGSSYLQLPLPALGDTEVRVSADSVAEKSVGFGGRQTRLAGSAPGQLCDPEPH